MIPSVIAEDSNINNYNLDVLVCAHRGAYSAADNYGTALPENSRASFLRAIELNSDLIECDVHKTSDDEIVVIHDSSTGRTFNDNYAIASNTLSTLSTLSMSNGETIPTLDEFIQIVKNQPSDGHLTGLRIEIKALSATEIALQKVFDAGIEDMCEWISFSSGVGAIVQSKYSLAGKTTKIGYLCGNVSGFSTHISNGFNMIDCNGLSDENALAARNAGLSLGAWTYNNESDFKQKMLQQYYSITTENVSGLQSLIDRLKRERELYGANY